MYQISDCWSREILSFDFLGKVQVLASPPPLVYDFLRKYFFMLYFVDWPNFIVSLLLLLEILDKKRIVCISFPIDDVMNFEIKLNVLIEPFFYMAKVFHRFQRACLYKKLTQTREWLFQFHLDSFCCTGLFLYSTKVSENEKFSDIFMRYRKKMVPWNGTFFFEFLHLKRFAYIPKKKKKRHSLSGLILCQDHPNQPSCT